jgi:putative transposase
LRLPPPEELKTYTRGSAPRLSPSAYRGGGAYFVTLNTHKGGALFGDGPVIQEATDILFDQAAKSGFHVYCYTFMPDHVHLLCWALSDAGDLAEFVRVYKQRSAHAFKSRAGRTLWQRSYYDHVVSNEESVDAIAAYILDNPRRRGLVTRWEDYPYQGVCPEP